MKKCVKCGRELPETEFYACKGNKKDGLQAYCKDCMNHLDYPKKRKTIIVDPSDVEKIENAPTGKYIGLSSFTPRQLMDELRNRGYSGTLTFTKRVTL